MQDTPQAPHPTHVQAPQMAPPPHHAQSHHMAHGDYSSNPMDTTKAAFTSFWQHSKQTVIAMVAIDTILAIVAGFAAIVAFVAAMAAIFFGLLQAGNELATYVYNIVMTQLPPDFTNALEGLRSSTGVTIVVAIITGLIAAFVGTLMQASYFAYTAMSVVNRQTAHVGHAMSIALKRTGPLLVQSALMLAVVILALFLFGVLAGFVNNGFFAIVLLVIFGIVAVMLALRVAFSSYAVVAVNLGPIQSLVHSWKLTRKRTWELLGALTPIAIISLVVDLIFTILYTATQKATGLSLPVMLLEMIVTVGLGLLGAAVVAQFYKQVRIAAEAGVHHVVNYGLNIGAFAILILAALISGSIQNSINPQTPAVDLNNYTTPSNSLYDDSTQYNSDDLYDNTPYNYQ